MTDLPIQPQPEDEARASFSDETVKLPGGEDTITHCPACKIGVLYVIAYDPEATHEQGNEQASTHAHFEPSGGSQIVRCFHCGITSSQPLGAKEAS